MIRIFENVFKRLFYIFLNISGLLANLPDKLKTSRCMKNMRTFFETKSIHSEKFLDKN